MKGEAMRRVMRKWERIRAARTISKASADDLHPPLLAKRSRQQSSSSGIESPPADSNSPSCSSLACVGGGVRFAKRPKRLVTILVGKEQQIFHVEPHILHHRLLERLLARSRAASPPSSSSSSSCDDDDKENEAAALQHRHHHGRKRSSGYGAMQQQQPIRLDCDAILFDHILWLLNNDDPAIRQLNIDELMEFYD